MYKNVCCIIEFYEKGTKMNLPLINFLSINGCQKHLYFGALKHFDLLLSA